MRRVALYIALFSLIVVRSGWGQDCLTVAPSQISLGTKLAGSTFTRTLTITNSTCSGPVLGTLSENVEWLTSIAPPDFQLTRGAQVVIAISGYFPSKPGSFTADIEVKWFPGNNSKKVRVFGVSDVPPSLSVSPKDIDLGKKPADNAFTTSFSVKNIGGRTLEGNVSEFVPWILAVEPNSFNLTAASEVRINLLGRFPSSPGPFSTKLGINSNGGNAEVSVHGAVQKLPTPILVVSTEEIDLGTKPPGSAFSESFMVKNGNGGTLTGAFSNQVPWIDRVAPNTFALTEGDEVTIEVSGKFPSIQGAFIGKLLIDSNGGDDQVEIHGVAQDAPTCLTIAPDGDFDLGSERQGTGFTASITITNTSCSAVLGSVSVPASAEWVSVSPPADFGLTRGASQTILLSGQFPTPPGRFATTITIESTVGIFHKQIFGEVVEPSSCLTITPKGTIDLGMQPAGTDFTRSVTILNSSCGRGGCSGGIVVSGSVSIPANVDWVVVEPPAVFRLPVGESQAIALTGRFPAKPGQPFSTTITIKSTVGTFYRGIVGEVDPVTLASKGRMARELYLRYVETPGWWNGNQAGYFTAIEFLALMLAYELGPLQNAKPIMGTGRETKTTLENDLSHGTTHWFYSQCAVSYSKNTCGGITSNVIFNFLGRTSESTIRRYRAVVEEGKPIEEVTPADQAHMVLANQIVAAILNPPDPEWTRTGLDSESAVDFTHPFYWGNESMLDRKPNSDEYLWKIEGGNPWYLFSIDVGGHDYSPPNLN